MLNLLNSLPANGYKTLVFIALAAVALGLEQLGYIPSGMGNQVVAWLSLLAGVSLTHKVMKVQASVDAGNSTTVPVNGVASN